MMKDETRVIAYCERCDQEMEIYEKFEYENPDDLIEIVVIPCSCEKDDDIQTCS